MSPDDPGRVYFLACDHRASFRRSLFGQDVLTPVTAARAGGLKRIVFDGLRWAIDHGVDRAEAALLMDTETGAEVVALAQQCAIPVAIPVERGGGQPVFEFDHGSAFGETIERIRPDYAKALVQYNPGADAKLNALSRDRLRRLSRWLCDGGPQFLLELLVPATAEQLRSVGGDNRRYDAELRAGLMVRAISQLQADGISPHVWKVEGLDTLDDCRVVAEQCRSVTPDTSCIVLGRGASIDQVRSWLTMAGQAGGYDGFAVGRSIWLAPLTAHLAGRADRAVTVARIGMTYQSLTRVFAQATGGGR